MALLRIDVERALDELVANEEGLRFQGLALVLGKRRWPELIAHQRKKDRGLDAYAPPSQTTGRIGKGLAASITSTLPKISEIAETAKRNFPDLRALLFVTSAKVGNAARKRWAEAIQRDHALELLIIEREEIIVQMLIPGNATLWGTFLQRTSSCSRDTAHAAPLVAGDVFSSFVFRGNDFLDRLTDIVLREAALDRSQVAHRRLFVDTAGGYDDDEGHLELDPSISFVELVDGSRLAFRLDHIRQLARQLALRNTIGMEPIRAKIGMRRGQTYDGGNPFPIGKFTVEIIYLRDFKPLSLDERIEYLIRLLFAARCEFSYIWGGNTTSLYDGCLGAEVIRSLDIKRVFTTVVSKIVSAQAPRDDDDRHVTLNSFYWHIVEEYKNELADSWDKFMNAMLTQRHHLATAANQQIDHYFSSRIGNLYRSTIE